MTSDNQYGFFQNSISDAGQYVSDAFWHVNDAFLNDWYLVPVLGVVGIGSAVVPHFALGLAVGAASFIVNVLA